ncbi:di-trans,poly-cis-decaprenylcistransferase [bacterium]|nr:di-trans,poly-cis-decaprenylcistransferase [bacterium]
MTKTLKHIAIIPDGNRRWARAQGLSVLSGHKKVVDEVFPKLVEKAVELGIECLTLWVFSTENWGRDHDEVEGLMKLFVQFCDRANKELNKQGIRVSFIGRRDNLPEELQKKMTELISSTNQNNKMLVNIALNYGGRDEIVRAVNKILERGEYSEIGEQTLSDYLDTSTLDLPDPDLIIRPGGEKRLSGFMSWQAAYSELYFSDKMMPEFGPDDLQAAVDDFYSRQRRFGK